MSNFYSLAVGLDLHFMEGCREIATTY